MKISVVIPAYNEEKYIGRCLCSIKTQAIPKLIQVETMVVLPCTDKTEELAHSYGALTVKH